MTFLQQYLPYYFLRIYVFEASRNVADTASWSSLAAAALTLASRRHFSASSGETTVTQLTSGHTDVSRAEILHFQTWATRSSLLVPPLVGWHRDNLLRAGGNHIRKTAEPEDGKNLGPCTNTQRKAPRRGICHVSKKKKSAASLWEVGVIYYFSLWAFIVFMELAADRWLWDEEGHRNLFSREHRSKAYPWNQSTRPFQTSVSLVLNLHE